MELGAKSFECLCKSKSIASSLCFLICKNSDNNTTHLKELLWELNEKMYLKLLGEFSALFLKIKSNF